MRERLSLMYSHLGAARIAAQNGNAKVALRKLEDAERDLRLVVDLMNGGGPG